MVMLGEPDFLRTVLPLELHDAKGPGPDLQGPVLALRLRGQAGL